MRKLFSVIKYAAAAHRNSILPSRQRQMRRVRSPTEEAIRDTQESLRQVLRRFIISTDAVKVRDEVSKEQMVRDFRVPEDHPALRCLMKVGYVDGEGRDDGTRISPI